MKSKLILIITAAIAAYPLSAFADTDIDTEPDIEVEVEEQTDILATDNAVSSDIYFTDDLFDPNEITADEYDFYEEDISDMSDEALLNGEAVPWDGVSIAEPSVAEDGAYEIVNAAQLAWIAQEVNSQKDSVGNYIGMYGKTIRLEDDVDLSGFEWIPIGNYYYCPFAGTFDGQGHTIKGLSLGDGINGTQGGLFGCVIGTVSDLNVETYGDGIVVSRSVTSTGYEPWQNGIGIIAGTVEKRTFAYNNSECTGTLQSCTASGAISVSNIYGEEFYVGGICGRNNGGVLTGNANFADITINKNTSPKTAETVYIGGIAGYNAGEISVGADSDKIRSNTISVSSAYPNVGVIAGGNSGVIKNITVSSCGLTTSLNVKKSTSDFSDNINIGQIVGINEGGEISECSAFTSLMSLNCSADSGILNIGAVAGLSSAVDNSDGGIISDCSVQTDEQYADLANTSNNIGAIVGNVTDENASITDCSSAGTLKIENAVSPVNAGGIAGACSGLIDSCLSELAIDVSSSSDINAGGIAGISYNTVTDCINRGSVSTLDSASESLIYTGGISGVAYGNILRSTLDGSVSGNAVQAYTGGMAGFAGYKSGSTIMSDSISSRTNISECLFSENASVSGTYISGGIVGSASEISIDTSVSEGTVAGIERTSLSTDGTEASVAAAGIAGMTLSELTINDCYVTAKLRSASAAGAVYAVIGSKNNILTSYLAPTFDSSVTETYQTVNPSALGEISMYALYINKDITGAEDTQQSGIVLVSSDEAKLKSTFTKSADQQLNFDNIWVMGDTSPDLQFRRYSNSIAEMTEETTSNLSFHVTLENPKSGQHVYVALYNKNGRFCGTTSAVCSDEYINSTGTKAEFKLDYSYNYWYNPKNYDENGDPKPEDEWIPSDYVPASSKVFTWNEENGLQNVSSVRSYSYYIFFDE